jgi:hypothetical protein
MVDDIPRKPNDYQRTMQIDNKGSGAKNENLCVQTVVQ